MKNGSVFCAKISRKKIQKMENKERQNMKEILKIEHIKKSYANGANVTTALKDISFTVREGEFISIMGASGSGKTTLLNCISAIDEATEGKLIIDGTELGQLDEKGKAEFRRTKLGFIFQDYNLLDTLTVEENISLALTINHVPLHKIKESVEEIAEKFHIRHILKKYPYEISGGEKQRCACGRAVIHNPKLVLADEPTGALDSGNSQELMEWISSMNRDNDTTVLVVTHDILVSCYAERTLFLKDGMVYEELAMKDMSSDEKLRRLMDVEARIRRTA